MFCCFYLTILCSMFAVSWSNTNKPSKIIIVKRDDEMACVTNSSGALALFNPDTHDVSNSVSVFVPNTDKSFDCKIEECECNSNWIKEPWTLKHSLKEKFVLDRRWEGLQEYRTEHANHGDNLKYQFIDAKVDRGDFEMYLSIRIANEAHLFLCDGSHPSESNCYWFMLQAFQGNQTALRKCLKSEIPKQSGSFIQRNSCNKLLVAKTHSINNPVFLSAWEWRHFKLMRKGNNISFSVAKSSTSAKNIISFTDEEPFQDATNIILHSKVTNGSWKVHKYNYITTTEITEQILGSTLKVFNGTFCISLFVSMCISCKLKLELIRTNWNAMDKSLQTLVHEPESLVWTEIRFAGQISEEINEVNLRISTILGNTLEIKPYWAIDHVSLCREHGFRVLKSKQNFTTCQLVSNQNEIILFKKSTDYIGNNCPPSTVGKGCIQCKWIFDGCHRVKICEKESTGNVICSCGAGSTGEDCKTRCPDDNYGFGCRMVCGSCTSTCNPIDGMCPRNLCEKNFTGDRCNIPPAAIFNQPPVIQDVGCTSATVKMSNFTIVGSAQSSLKNYQIQYKNDNVIGSSWIIHSPTLYTIGQDLPILIGNLQSNTNYLVRAVINDPTYVYNKYTYDDEYVRYTLFKTTCKVINADDVTVKSTNNSILISVQIEPTTCQVKYLDFKINGYSPTKINKRDYLFNFLNAATNYTLYYLSNFLKVIRTEDGRPTQVRNVHFDAITATSLKIKWTEPEHKNGEITNYVVKYKHFKYERCNNVSNSKSKSLNPVFKGADMETLVDNLIPYSNYSFTIYARNTIIGDPTTEYQTTRALDTITQPEIPDITIDTSPFSVYLNLSTINCMMIRGPLHLGITFKCTNEWCSNNLNNTTRIYNTSLDVNDLLPFSNYVMDINVCRRPSNNCSTSVMTLPFKTKPTVPNQVDGAIVYSKGDDYISVRWKPPYPPTGILKEFQLKYSLPQIKPNMFNIDSNSSYCKIWPEFYCVTLQNLETGKIYQVDILARNVDPAVAFGQEKTITATTIIEAPEAPYGLKINSNDASSLELFWNHPNVTNGNLTHFKVHFQKSIREPPKILTLSIEEETYMYSYPINATLMPSTVYSIYVTAFNGKESSKSSSVTYTSPPPIPILVEDPQYRSTNVSITVTIPSLKESPEADLVAILVFISDQELDENTKSEILATYKIKILKLSRNFKEAFSKKYKSVYNKNITTTTVELNDLKPKTEYEIVVVLVSEFQNVTRHKVYQKSTCTLGGHCTLITSMDETSNKSLWALLLLLLLIPISIFAYLKRKTISAKFRFLRRVDDLSEEIEEGESMPLAKKSPNAFDEPRERKTLPVKKVTPFAINHSKRVKITEFEKYVRESLASGELERQHGLFPRGLIKPCKYGEEAANKSKNRYKNLIAYDHTRIVLEKIPGKEYSDYINANYIDGYQVPQAYIATQGPKASTLFDFWRMIWQENVKHIIMLANVYENKKKKVEKYWPDINENLEYNDITIQHVSSSVFADYENNVFNVSRNGELREINQLHFTSWPDHGVPLYCQSLVPFLQSMLSIPLKYKSPIVVHCSAGVGRTGTVILCDYSLRMAAKEGSMDILNILQKIREQRSNLVDNIEQYKLAHLVILECLLGMRTAISCSEITESVQDLIINNGIKLQMQYLKDTVWKDQAMKPVGNRESQLLHHKKNRFHNIVPEVEGRIFLSPYPTNDETSSYINAVQVDGFKSPGRFIVTQQPLPNTLGDFWRLVEEYNISVILSLNKIDTTDKTSCEFWPSEEGTQISPVDFMCIEFENLRKLECYDLITVRMYLHGSKDCRSIEIILLKKWPAKSNLPTSVEEFLTYWEESDALCRRSDKVLVTCYDGAGAAGVYVAMSFIIEKMKLEQVCDVCLAVRTVRRHRPEFINNEEQFKFLYEAAVKYIEGFQSYANFN